MPEFGREYWYSVHNRDGRGITAGQGENWVLACEHLCTSELESHLEICEATKVVVFNVFIAQRWTVADGSARAASVLVDFCV